VRTTLFCLILIGWSTSAWTAGPRLGYVELQKIILGVEEGRSAREKLEREYQDKKRELEKMEAELKQLKASLEQQSMILNEAALKKKQEDFQQKFLNYQRLAATYQNDIRETEAKETVKIIEKVKQIVNELAAKEGFTYVFEKSDNVLLFAPESDNLTQKVIEIYNARKGKGGK